LTAQQQAIQQALGGAGQLAGLGGQALEAQKGIAGLQNQYGAQQQSLEQQKINQAIQDYSNAQQYPLMQLGTMSNMLRGLPMQAQTTQQYVAAPNALTQGIGMAGAGASLYNAFNPTTGKAAGGVISMAKGGIASVPQYDVGGEVESDLESMPTEALAREAKESPSPIIRQKAQRILRERQMEQAPQAPQGIQYQAPQVPQAPQGMAGGGIIAFRKGDVVYGGPSSEENEGEGEAVALDATGKTMTERLATPPAGGIMGAGAAPTAPAAPAAYVSQAGPAMQRATDIPEFMRAQYADLANEAGKSLADRMAERKAMYAAEGVADVSEGQQMQRAEMMAQKSNMGEERQRQINLRLAEFFAEWGSTPGPTLVAGMNALKKAVPNFVADEKEQKKLRREIDKSIADLDNAMRLEKRGDIDAADAKRQKSADNLKDAYGKFVEYDSRRKTDAAGIRGQQISAEASNYRAQLQLRGDELRANQSRLDRAAMRETADDNKRFGQYQTASTQEQRLISKIADQAKMFDREYATIKTAEMNAAANDGKMNPALVPGYEAAKKKIDAQEKIWNEQKASAARDTELAYSRVRLNPESAAAKPKDKAAPAAAPSNRPPLNDPSLQKQ
jgi:soluble cytochrome b562